jgi:tripartite-type tricarboxylate transporter receptor subunit TctC
MTVFKRVILAAIAFAAISLPAAPANAQDWPNRPVKVVVPFGAGGAADRLGRIAADHISKAIKQHF